MAVSTDVQCLGPTLRHDKCKAKGEGCQGEENHVTDPHSCGTFNFQREADSPGAKQNKGAVCEEGGDGAARTPHVSL